MGFYPFTPLPVLGSQVTPPLTLSQAAAAGGILTVTDTTAAPTAAPLGLFGVGAGDRALGIRVTGDTFDRVQVDTAGSIKWGPGNGGADAVLGRSAAGLVAVSTGSFDVSAVGQGLRVAEGANAKQGTAVLVGGTVTVANTSVTANSRILLTTQVVGGTAGFLVVSARVAGTSFTILSSSGTDTSTVGWEIFEPG